MPPQSVDAPPRKVFIETFGCQMNVLDTEIVLTGLVRDGYAVARTPEEADLYLFNTCSVREHAEDRVWSRLGELKRRKRREPDLVIGVLGCMAQKEKELVLRRAPHVDLVVGTHEFPEVPRLVRELEALRAPIVAADLTAPIREVRDVALREEKYHAYVTVMRGCDFSCSFCVVPHTRGPETNRPIQEVREEVSRLAADGVREVTLLGQTIDSYGKRLPPIEGAAGPRRPDLGDLLEAVHEVPGILRIRFITSHPSLLREPILRRMGELEKVCEYLHMPAQSGSDPVLRRMRRGYTVARYREIVAMARSLVEGVAIAGDFIVGFPGETDGDFEETCALLREVGYAQSFIFRYSPRRLTEGFSWEDDVPLEVKRERNSRLLEVQEEVSLARQRALVGEAVEVLVEGPSKTDPARLCGRTRQNGVVVFEGPRSLVGELARVRVESCTPLTLFGRLADGV